MKIKAVFWDFGGVLTTSPFEAFNRFERENHLPQNFIRMVNAANPDTNAWARLERSEISLEAFDRAFERETAAAGHAVRGMTVLELLSGDLRPEMVEALRRCKKRFLTACLTNNMKGLETADLKQGGRRAAEIQAVMDMFDYIVESSKIGCRKPDPRFYEIACQTVNVAPPQVVFLDDLGINLKPARAMGMHTIKVTDSHQALTELGSLLGLALVG
ncbi:MAG: HAD-IA family hydrolase [Desulfobacterales bacterium]|nr:MAG: HAD-IA family hydrolase [Desulfobacterales bacterium]